MAYSDEQQRSDRDFLMGVSFGMATERRIILAMLNNMPVDEVIKQLKEKS